MGLVRLTKFFIIVINGDTGRVIVLLLKTGLRKLDTVLAVSQQCLLRFLNSYQVVNHGHMCHVQGLNLLSLSFVKGFFICAVSLVGTDERMCIKILCDTAAFDSLILPSACDMFTGSFIPVLGMGLKVLHVPLHKMMLSCDPFQGKVAVGVRPALPLDGVTIILGNDICGSRVRPNDPPPAIVEPASLVSSGPDRNKGRVS